MNFPPPQVPPPLPRARQFASRAKTSPRRERQQTTRFTNAIIAINVAVYVWMSVNNFENVSLSLVISRSFLERGEWYRLITAGFVHFGGFHLVMNMLLAFQLGKMIEPLIGSMRYSFLYFASLIGGSLGAVIVSPHAITGGASGAVFGVMAATVVGMGRVGYNPLRTGLGVTFLINIGLTLTIPGISIGGHFGGALVGAIIGVVLLRPSKMQN